ncbi:S8 family serine peptidase [Pyxidicoccus parkwayensis]|uniref:S8 family serine peptidase n=1 Tax=Pyxidicoccus parkwayensis TaxID=2813578 RepID=A0ABX7NW12_9BACT|nr:S8 family serine peptidase [Pyxidicoccus parkwaysis]QSQ21670.1 S8 family serine peptidase [Pyxidicoccus parkwaysis]
MKRWVWLGLVGGLMACSEKKPPSQVEPQNCPGTTEESLPNTARAQALSSEDGLEDVLITFRPRVSASAKANTEAFATDVSRAGGQVRRRFPNLNLVSARLTPEAREALAQNPDVVSVRPNRKVHAFGMPRIPTNLFLRGTPNTAGSVGEYTPGVKMVQATEVWDANNDGALDPGSPSGTGIKVCVIDSGWDDRHPELKAAVIGGMDFVDREDDLKPTDPPGDGPLDRELKGGAYVYGGGHGTHTAGTIAAQLGAGGKVRPGQEPNGVAGVAPTVSLLIARVLDVTGSGNTDDVIAAVEWCQKQGANIASLSLGSSTKDDDEELAFNAALQGGMLSFAATGNSGADKVAFPAAYASVVAVGAVDFNGAWASFSQFGPQVSLVGPGVEVLSSTIVGASPFSEVSTGQSHFDSNPLEYSAINTYTGRLVDCGLGDSITSCGEGATCEGFVAYVDRGGGILFEDKARNAIHAGAKAVIIGNNDADTGEGNFTLNAPSPIWVPTTSISLANSPAMKALAGQQVTVDVSGTDYLVQTGTSMATPHVAGVAALLWSARRDLNASQIRQALESSAKDLGPTGRDSQYGYGLVQAVKAIQYANTQWPRQVP